MSETAKRPEPVVDPTARIRRLSEAVDIAREERFPLSVTKAVSITESFKETEGEPHILRQAKAFARVIERAELFVEEDQLIVGNPSTRPWGVELTPLWGVWPESEIDSLEEAGYVLDDDVRERLPELNDYWHRRSLTARMGDTYDDERLWPYAQMGVALPAFRSKEEGWGAGGLLGGGYGIHHEINQLIATPDFERVLSEGLGAYLAEIDAADTANHLYSPEAFERRDFLRAARIAVQAVQTLIRRFGEIARHDSETATPERRAELIAIAEACEQLESGPARSFREAIQMYWFVYLAMLPSGTLGMGRIDQILRPWYEADLAAGAITYADAVELFACLRLRSMEITIQGGRAHRAKWAGGSKWHNAVIGGQDADGADATNDLSYAVIDAAHACPTPHFTITLRVHEGIDAELLRAGLQLARTGLGMPAFVSDEGAIDYLLEQGIELSEARDYNMAGSNSVTVTGASRMVASPMFTTPRVLGITLHGGVDPRTGFRMGEEVRPFEEMESFDELLDAFAGQLETYLGLQAEFNNVTIRSIGERYPRPFDSVVMRDGIAEGKDVFRRVMPYENSNLVNPIGVINAADSLAAIRHVVFETKQVPAGRLLEALDRDWSGDGDEAIRALCLAAPKYGNDDDRADELAAWIYDRCARSIVTFGTSTGGMCKPSALTIGTSPWPGGVSVGASADGRGVTEPLAEESMTPMRGRETGTLWDVVRSAVKIDQSPYQTTELDLRITKAALEDEQALANLADLVMAYFAEGGKHVQFNVADPAELRAAIDDPEGRKDVTIRLGGTTAYFVQLSPDLQQEILKRHYFDEVPAAPAPVPA